MWLLEMLYDLGMAHLGRVLSDTGLDFNQLQQNNATNMGNLITRTLFHWIS